MQKINRYHIDPLFLVDNDTFSVDATDKLNWIIILHTLN